MREILFRGKSIISGEWVFGTPVCVEEKYIPTDRVLLVRSANYDELDNFLPQYESEEVDPATVGQFTGLYDRNGNKVFEGDVLEIYEDGGETSTGKTSVVEFGHYNCGCCHCVYGFSSSDENDYEQALRFLFENPPTEKDLADCRACGDSVSVIIGNIHDNPELLEVKK